MPTRYIKTSGGDFIGREANSPAQQHLTQERQSAGLGDFTNITCKCGNRLNIEFSTTKTCKVCNLKWKADLVNGKMVTEVVS